MSGHPEGPEFRLDELATAWLKRDLAQLAAMPGLQNQIGAVQMESDPVAIKHAVFPPYSGGDEVSAFTAINGRLVMQQCPHVQIRWRPDQVERRCSVGPFEIESTTALAPHDPIAVVILHIRNRPQRPADLALDLILSGRSRNTGPEGYAWAVPVIATNVFSFTKNEGLSSTAEIVEGGRAVLFTNDAKNGFCAQGFDVRPQGWRGACPRWRTTVDPGRSFDLRATFTFCTAREEALRLLRATIDHASGIVERATAWYEDLWQAAFTPGNGIFSGWLPRLETDIEPIRRIYYTAAMTLITCRRSYAHAVKKPLYLTIWPRRGEGSSYLAWELPYVSAPLARLDPAALKSEWQILASAPLLDYQVTNYFTGRHGGWACSAHPQALIEAASRLLRIGGDRSILGETVLRQRRSAAGFEAASQGQIVEEGGQAPPVRPMTGAEVLSEAYSVYDTRRMPGTAFVDLGGRGAYHECVTTYAHATAGMNAFFSSALQYAPLFGLPSRVADADALRGAVTSLYRREPASFECLYPDGRRVSAPNLYDLGMVLTHLGATLPKSITSEVYRFVLDELRTPTWAHNLWPLDPDIASGIRADHQWAGCFPAWISQFAIGAARSGVADQRLTDWLTGVAEVTRQGPFGQAYWAEDIHPLEAGAAAKCYDELTQGNHWVIGSGAHFTEAVIEGICGIQVDESGCAVKTPGLPGWEDRCRLYGIRTGAGVFQYQDGSVTGTAG